MDHPIIYDYGMRPPKYVPSADRWNLNRRLNVALAIDEKSEFMTLIQDPEFDQVRISYTAYKIISYDALEIALAVLNGETEGLIETADDELKESILHLATIYCAPRLTQYLLQNGFKVDAVCDIKKFNRQNVTPIGLSTCNIIMGDVDTIFQLLFHICYHNRRRVEVIRMLVRSEQNMWAMEAFVKYVQKGELPELTALFLATPELFLKSPESGELSLLSKQYLELSSLEHKTHIVKQLLLLLDVFALVGHKLAAYLRLEEFKPKDYTTEEIERTMLEIMFCLSEAAELKHGRAVEDSAQYVDYYLRFFEVGKQNSGHDDLRADEDDDDDDVQQHWNKWTSKLKKNDVLYILPYLLQRPGFKRPEIYRIIPTLHFFDKVRLDVAITFKLLSMPALRKEVSPIEMLMESATEGITSAAVALDEALFRNQQERKKMLMLRRKLL